MNTTFEKYLDTIDKCLKPLPTSERVDIVKEIKGSILEMESENLSTEQILTRLGKPKDLAKAYLGDLLAKENGFSWNRFLTVCAFYSLVGFSGLFVIPVLVIVAPTFILCGVASAVLGIIKLVDYLLHLNIPYVDYIGFQFGNTALSPIPVFILSLITGIILFLLGRGAWKLLITYCKQFFQKRIKGRGYCDVGTSVISEFYTPLVPKGHDFLQEIGRLEEKRTASNES